MPRSRWCWLLYNDWKFSPSSTLVCLCACVWVCVGVRERERVCVSRCWIRSNEFPLKFQQHQSVTIVLNAEVRCNYIKNVIRACRMWNNDSYFPNLPLARVDDDTEIFSFRFSTIKTAASPPSSTAPWCCCWEQHLRFKCPIGKWNGRSR